MTNALQQRLAVSVIIGQCEAIIRSGQIDEALTRETNWCIDRTRIAFGLPRQDNTSTSEYDAQLDQVGVEIGGTQHG